MTKNARKPGTSALSPEQLKVMVRMAAGGATQRQIAKELKVSQATVARGLADSDATKPVPRRRRAGVAAKASAPSSLEAEAGALEADAADAIASGDERWLVETLTQVDKNLKTALSASNHQATATYAKLSVELRLKRIALRPPLPPDPNADPANREAREVLHARVREMVERSERANAQTESPAA